MSPIETVLQDSLQRQNEIHAQSLGDMRDVSERNNRYIGRPWLRWIDMFKAVKEETVE